MPEPHLVTHLAAAGLRVPDPEAAAAYYEHSLGLVRVPSADGSELRLSVAPRRAVVVSSGDIVLREGNDAGLAFLTFGVASRAELDHLAARLERGGVEALPSSIDGELRVDDPDGCEIRVAVSAAQQRRPAGLTTFSFRKLGHVTRRSPDPKRQAEWWQSIFAFRLSDQIEETFFFLRCNQDHHAVAFAEGSGWDAHHVGLELESWDDLRLVVEHLVATGNKIEFGPGRHGPGNNIFLYYLDPWGIRWELFCELEQIADDADREPGWWKGGRRDTVNLWGPTPPESYFN
jgi:catechol 2,3-dioxygenase-like lactoylglutathione lyase family enzyme